MNSTRGKPKRLLSLLLAAMMLVSMLPVSALAAEIDVSDEDGGCQGKCYRPR